MSLEDISVLALAEVSGTSVDSPVDMLATRRCLTRKAIRKKQTLQFMQPCLRLKRRETPMTNTAFTDIVPGMKSFKTFGAAQSLKCKCLFVGGGGFKSMNKNVPCESKLCLNRMKPRFVDTYDSWPQIRPASRSMAPLRPQDWLQHRPPKPRISLKISNLLKRRQDNLVVPPRRLIEVRLEKLACKH